MQRGLRLWRKWDASAEAGDPPVTVLAEVSDESLLELLATGGAERRYACNLILTEVLNRLARTRFEVLATTDATRAFAEDARRLVDVARQQVTAPRTGPGSPHWLLRRLEHDRVLVTARVDALRDRVFAHAREREDAARRVPWPR